MELLESRAMSWVVLRNLGQGIRSYFVERDGFHGVPNDQAQPRRVARSAMREDTLRRADGAPKAGPSAGAQGWALAVRFFS